jgi:hypothetical protein
VGAAVGPVGLLVGAAVGAIVGDTDGYETAVAGCCAGGGVFLVGDSSGFGEGTGVGKGLGTGV